MSDYPMLISNKLHSFRNFAEQSYKKKDDVVSMIPSFLYSYLPKK